MDYFLIYHKVMRVLYGFLDDSEVSRLPVHETQVSAPGWKIPLEGPSSASTNLACLENPKDRGCGCHAHDHRVRMTWRLENNNKKRPKRQHNSANPNTPEPASLCQGIQSKSAQCLTCLTLSTVIKALVQAFPKLYLPPDGPLGTHMV